MRTTRFLALVVLVAVFVSGCFWFGGKPRAIKVAWETITDSPGVSIQGVGASSVQLLSAMVPPLFGESMGYEVTYAASPLTRTVSEVTATLVGGRGGETFNFAIDSSIDYGWSRLSANKIRIQNDVPGEGQVIVTHDDLSVIVPFIVFPAGGIVNSECWVRANTCGIDIGDLPEMGQGFSFVDGVPVPYDDGDIRVALGERVISTPFGHAKYPVQTFWDEFRTIVDVRHLSFDEYEIQTDVPPYGYVYFIRTADGGYVKLRFEAQRSYQGDAWSFVYQYSPDGTFQAY